MKYQYSNNEFYPYVLKQDYIKSGIWPNDGIDVDESVFKKYTATPPIGKTRVIGNDGLPTWGKLPPLPPLTADELKKHAEFQKQELLRAANEKIDICQDAVDLSLATDEEKAMLIEWRKYRVLLSRIDCSTSPDIVWPELPKG
ncbi:MULTISPECIES: tail fiber assembly protein [unclassified Xenorhabdus]|uniref:tail fiber assembly protein n=1 Tax=unclassified Xenorhabdus TaxID=2632833 RepID=UPI000C056C58|nr:MULTISPECIES: tail fiber assembly protein [unclassified Xenorhabdus]MCC8380213.1 tail fiber assembly protein [Xenorhabdus sp. PB30.3]PHM51168.1 tail assembly chaperone [Xenorhabdus sp. KK7.4]